MQLRLALVAGKRSEGEQHLAKALNILGSSRFLEIGLNIVRLYLNVEIVSFAHSISYTGASFWLR